MKIRIVPPNLSWIKNWIDSIKNKSKTVGDTKPVRFGRYKLPQYRPSGSGIGGLIGLVISVYVVIILFNTMSVNSELGSSIFHSPLMTMALTVMMPLVVIGVLAGILIRLFN